MDSDPVFRFGPPLRWWCYAQRGQDVTMAEVSLDDGDLRRLLGTAGALSEPDSGDSPSDMIGLLELVGKVVRSDAASWSRLDLSRRRVLAGTTTAAHCDDDALEPAFWAHYHE